ncbi:hypothetical protein BKI52_07725 [marine bacterium AO1-C]|nr:hypothetical protein BKI52_07725 [marine bacterium AO1-C]
MLGLYQPPLGFHFAVSMVDSPTSAAAGGLMGKMAGALKTMAKMAVSYDNSFMEISGLSATVQMETIQAGGVNDFVYKVPKGIEYSNLVLKRGLVTLSSELQDWCQDSIHDPTFAYQQKDVSIMLMNNYHVPLMTWKLIKAVPVKYEASGFDAMSGKIMVESIELCYQKYEVSGNKVLAAMQMASMATGGIQAAANAASGAIDKAVNSTIGQAEKMAKDIVEVNIDKPDIDTDIDINPGFNTY